MRRLLNILTESFGNPLQDYLSMVKTPGAVAWGQSNLKNFIAKGNEVDDDSMQLLAGRADALNMDAHRITRISVPDMLKSARAASVPSKRALKGRSGPAKWASGSKQQEDSFQWKNDTHRSAIFKIGRAEFEVFFQGGDHGAYERGWTPRTRGLVKKTGMFPRINAMLKTITLDFLKTEQPRVLIVRGADAKRNTFNTTEYATWTPPGYKFFTMKHDPDDPNERASPNGVIAVGFRKE